MIFCPRCKKVNDTPFQECSKCIQNVYSET